MNVDGLDFTLNVKTKMDRDGMDNPYLYIDKVTVNGREFELNYEESDKLLNLITRYLAEEGKAYAERKAG